MSKCPICFSALDRDGQVTGTGVYYQCPVCGRFAVDPHLIGVNDKLSVDDADRTRIKHLLAEHRLYSKTDLCISSSNDGPVGTNMARITVGELLARYPKTPLEFFDRALQNIARLVPHPVAVGMIMGQHLPLLFAEGDNVQAMLEQLGALGLVANPSSYRFRILPAGWRRLQELREPGRHSNQAFVAMWFDASHSAYFDEGIKPAIEADGLTRALRIDRKDHNNKIDDEIIAEIRRSRFVVADFTEHRGGVYFEAGYAQGMGLPVIWTVHERDIAKAHFDTRQYNHITYDTPVQLRDRLLNRIRATIT